ncbi:MAG: type II 3-dehydroquinate dehydratase [Nitrosomonadales bacterium]|nr:type II 3-dehydroquinate dehydratase [Nitrosomonadales bacterium]|tara:strand:- start:77 stop:511 length:435 start_codon:yes stop_codon:yes gene_type:complete
MKIKNITIIHGPNLNLLGQREPNHYGNLTLDDIDDALSKEANKLNLDIDFYQSNSESEIVNRIQSLKSDFIIINPAAYTHSSVAIRDALAAMEIPFIEVHISNVFSREDFRKQSFFSDIAVGVISGLGTEGYFAALNFVAKLNK